MAEKLNHEVFVRKAVVSLPADRNPDSVLKKMGLD